MDLPVDVEVGDIFSVFLEGGVLLMEAAPLKHKLVGVFSSILTLLGIVSISLELSSVLEAKEEMGNATLLWLAFLIFRVCISIPYIFSREFFILCGTITDWRRSCCGKSNNQVETSESQSNANNNKQQMKNVMTTEIVYLLISLLDSGMIIGVSFGQLKFAYTSPEHMEYFQSDLIVAACVFSAITNFIVTIKEWMDIIHMAKRMAVVQYSSYFYFLVPAYITEMIFAAGSSGFSFFILLLSVDADPRILVGWELYDDAYLYMGMSALGALLVTIIVYIARHYCCTDKCR